MRAVEEFRQLNAAARFQRLVHVQLGGGRGEKAESVSKVSVWKRHVQVLSFARFREDDLDTIASQWCGLQPEDIAHVEAAVMGLHLCALKADDVESPA